MSSPEIVKMDKVTSGSIEMTWDSESRLALIRFESETRATGQDAVQLVEALTRWIGTDGKPFGLLGDGGKLGALDAEYRSVWRKFFEQHRQDSYIAFFNMSPVVRVAAEMFRIGTGLRLKAFAGESEARAWLRGMGIIA
jgi:hypothetical protein